MNRVTIYDDQGEPVARSKNLRGVLTYARKHPVKRASVYAHGSGGGHIVFHFRNGSTCRADFASYAVAWQWVAARRSWGLQMTAQNKTLTDYRP